jgi:hypothetical protein
MNYVAVARVGKPIQLSWKNNWKMTIVMASLTEARDTLIVELVVDGVL